jgi:hypothetical protein
MMVIRFLVVEYSGLAMNGFNEIIAGKLKYREH